MPLKKSLDKITFWKSLQFNVKLANLHPIFFCCSLELASDSLNSEVFYCKLIATVNAGELNCTVSNGIRTSIELKSTGRNYGTYHFYDMQSTTFLREILFFFYISYL